MPYCRQMTEREIVSMLCSIGFRDALEATKHIRSALQRFPDLNPSKDFYVFPDGSQQPVLKLDGTVSVKYGGSTYNIPVCVYLQRNYPDQPPICYVRPTSSMVIKQSMHVDNNGLVYLPYLSEWDRTKSDLLSLIAVMVTVFSERCPVFTKTSYCSAPTAAMQSGYVTSSGYRARTTQPYGVVSNAVPRWPVVPSAKNNYPPYPTGPGGPLPAGVAGYPSVPSQARPPYPVANAQVNTNTIQPEHIRASLLSASEDLLRKKLFESISTLLGEWQSVKRTNEELLAGSDTLSNIVASLEQEAKKLDLMRESCDKKINEIDKVLGSVSEDVDDVPVDETIDATTPLYRQLVNCYAEDCAIDDALYYLGEAIKKNVIEIDQYLKLVRHWSRRQFILRATMKKCRELAGLQPV